MSYLNLATSDSVTRAICEAKMKISTHATSQAVSGEFLEFLSASGLLDPQARARIVTVMQSSMHSVDTVLLELGLLSETVLADAQAKFLGLDRVQAAGLPDELEPELVMPREFLQSAAIFPLDADEATITLATARPFDTDVIRGVGYTFGKRPIAKVAVASELAQHIRKFFDVVDQGPGVVDDQPYGGNEDDIERLRDVAREAPIIKLLNQLIGRATDQNASDIHIEPMEDHVLVRHRIDGSLQVSERLTKQVQQGLVSRIKILAKLNIAEQRLPQDGRIRLPVRGREVEFRVSTVPVTFGESVAIRVLDRKDLQLDYASLGYQPLDVVKLDSMTHHVNGIVLITGPTGSGKTTTLYAALSSLNRSELKLFTVEDPVEYRLKGVNQIQVKPAIGLDFAAVLRSVLRQDPDIIMVGEIRDAETARIAVQASLTGHLVLSTLHTNSAAASLTRLLDMGLEDYLLASTLRGIVAQRLLRKLCASCKSEVLVDNKLRQRLGVGQNVPVFKALGCSKCNATGYSGRTVAYEIMEIDDDQRRAISERQTERVINDIAIRAGMSSLYRTAISCVERGETSLEEVYRVIQAAGIAMKLAYRAYDQQGNLVTGDLDIASEHEAVVQLRLNGLIPFETKRVDVLRPSPNWLTRDIGMKGLGLADRARFCKSLAALLSAGVPLDRALRLMADQSLHGKIPVLARVAADAVSSGQSLATVLSRPEAGFAAHECGLVVSAEKSGNFPTILSNLAVMLDRHVELRGKLTSALVYPLFLVIMAIASLVLISTLLVPNLAPLFSESGNEPPFMINALMNMDVALKEYGWLVALAILALAGITVVVSLSASGKQFRDAARLRFKTARQLEASRLCKTLAALIDAGLPLQTAIRTAGQSVKNQNLRQQVIEAGEKVISGVKLSTAFEHLSVLDQASRQLIAIGEETNQLANMLGYLAFTLETSALRRIERLMTLLTPTITVALGLLIGTLILSVMRAILSVNELAL